MIDLSSLLLVGGAGGALAWVAARERRALLAARRSLLDRCRGLLESTHVTHAPDGFPKLTGTWRGAPVVLALFPDTLTPRRLPQLWLSITRPPVSRDAPVVDILVRPTGAEAYAFDASGLARFEAPEGLPGESLIRGAGARAERLLLDLATPLADLLADPRVKEITVTPRATRVIWQAAEGDRGNHLILRQATFEAAGVTADAVQTLLRKIDALANTAPTTRAVASRDHMHQDEGLVQ